MIDKIWLAAISVKILRRAIELQVADPNLTHREAGETGRRRRAVEAETVEASPFNAARDAVRIN
jgi:hypothetical protein